MSGGTLNAKDRAYMILCLSNIGAELDADETLSSD